MMIAISELSHQLIRPHSEMVIVISNFPTLLLMTSYSFFIYYIAKLTHLVDRQRSDSIIDDSVGNGIRAQDGRYIQVSRKIPNLIKPFFVVFNVMAYIAYFAIVGYCKILLIDF